MNELKTTLVLPAQDLKVLTTFEVRGNQLKEEALKLTVDKASDILTANSLFKQIQLTVRDIESHRKLMVTPFNNFVDQINGLAKEVSQSTAEAKLLVSEKLLAYNEKIEIERKEKAEIETKALREQQIREEKERKERDDAERKKRDAEEARLAEIERLQEVERQKINTETNALKKQQLEMEATKLAEEKKLEQQRIENEQAGRKIEQDRLDIEYQRKQMEVDEEKRKQAKLQEAIDKENKPKGLHSRYGYEIVDEEKVPRQYCTPDSKKINEAIKLGILTIEGLLIKENKRIQ